MSDKASNGNLWLKVGMCIMGAISLFSVGFAASSSTVAVEYHRIDTQGTQKTRELETRVIKVETILEERMKQLNNSLTDLTTAFRQHSRTEPAGAARGGSGN